jgi:hypothetical protein
VWCWSHRYIARWYFRLEVRAQAGLDEVTGCLHFEQLLVCKGLRGHVHLTIENYCLELQSKIRLVDASRKLSVSALINSSTEEL